MKITLTIWLGALLMTIIGLFWYSDWRYKLPTPVPENYQNVPVGQYISMPATLNINPGRPLLLHFFNPDCPCSKFNATHFRSLVQRYGNKVNFIIVPVSKNHYTSKDIQHFFHLNVPVLFDTSIARKCGVYSTPQAVVLDVNKNLYYRGNYNKSRYCTDESSNYALQALDAVLLHTANPLFDHYALQAYGCKLIKPTHQIPIVNEH